MSRVGYNVLLHPDPETGSIGVMVPAMPGVLTWGETEEAALAAAREAIELHLESYTERGQPFPSDRRMPGKRTVRVEAELPRRRANQTNESR